MNHHAYVILWASLLPTSLSLKVWSGNGAAFSEPATPKQRLRVISDLHIGSDCYNPDNETKVNLVKMLADMASGKDPVEYLVLNGDIWDWGDIGLNETTPHPRTLFGNINAHGYNVPQIIKLIKLISERTKVYMVRGNHDDLINQRLSKLAFGDAVQFMEDGFEINGVWIEHGHTMDPYANAPRRKREQKKMNWGYFVQRSTSTTHAYCENLRSSGAPPDFFVNIAKSTWSTMTKLYHTVVLGDEGFKKQAQMPENGLRSEIWEKLMIDSLPQELKKTDWKKIPVTGFDRKSQHVIFDSHQEEYTLGDVIQDHLYDFEVGIEQVGVEHFKTRLWTSIHHSDWTPYSRNHMVVVTSHTHDPLVELTKRRDPEKSLSESFVQVNSGCWGRDWYNRKHSSYVDIDFQQLPEAIEGLVPKGTWYPDNVAYYEYPETTPRQSTKVPKPTPVSWLKRKASGLGGFGGFDYALHPIEALHEMRFGGSEEM